LFLSVKFCFHVSASIAAPIGRRQRIRCVMAVIYHASPGRGKRFDYILPDS
jgi:hypothetical protein